MVSSTFCATIETCRNLAKKARQVEGNRAEPRRVGRTKKPDGDAIARKWPTLGEDERGRIKPRRAGKRGGSDGIGPLLRRRGPDGLQ